MNRSEPICIERVDFRGLPLDLTAEAAIQYPEATSLARSLDLDRASLEQVRRHMVHRQVIDESGSEAEITEYLKFLLLAAVTREPVAPSQRADAVWHTHITFTQHYDRFCRKHFGRFVHHVPSEAGFHPTESFQQKQNHLGIVFFGEKTIYADKAGSCHNGHDCHSCTVHAPESE